MVRRLAHLKGVAMGNLAAAVAANRVRLAAIPRRWRYALIGGHLAVLGALLVSVTNGRLRFPAYRVDLDVYRIGSTVLLHGGNLYGTLPSTQVGQQLDFTYPPFAAILLAPLAVVPYWLACIAMTLLTIGLLAVVLRLVLRSLDALPTGPTRWVLFGGLLLPAELIEPVRTASYAGQIDVALMALVALDVLTEHPRWPRGLLTGIAAALKLTPAVFILYLLLRRDGRAAVTAALSFLAATAIGFLCAGADSMRYWTGLVFNDSRVGSPSYAGDQSLLGLLTRFGIQTPNRTELWLLLVAVTIGVTVLGMRRVLAAHRYALALGLNAVCGLLISPISWSHHWVWIVVLLPALAVLGWRSTLRLPTALAGGGLVLFLAAPQWWWPHNGTLEYQWSIGQQLAGGGYVYFGAVLLLTAALARQTRPTVRDEKLRSVHEPAWTGASRVVR